MNLSCRPLGFKIEPGEYYVGDPCYVFPENEWSKFCDNLFLLKDDINGVIFTCDEIHFFVCGTAYGDGCYPLKKNKQVVGECGVDAGLLSIIPMKLVKKWGAKDVYRLGVIIEIEKGCAVNARGGDFTFGKYSVKTSD